MTADAATPLYDFDGDSLYTPQDLAAGPWHRGVLHGGAVSALLAGLVEHPDQVLTRVLVELLGPVPSAPLRAVVEPADGGRRVVRQTVVLHAGDRPVARALALRMRRDDLDLPPAATEHAVVFDPATAPELTTPNRRAAKTVGWESFDSLAMAARWDDAPSANGRRRMWMRLLVPVVPGRPATAIENVAAAADYGTSGTNARLDFATWSFMNADLVISLSRPPAPGWVGLDCDGLLSRTGTGQSVAVLHDTEGVLGQSSQSILLEARGRPKAVDG
jgi:hypothetical protein